MNRKSLAAQTQLKRLDSPAEFKLAGKAGSFEGYAAVFLNTDSGNDCILPGAFQEFVKTRDGKTLVLYQHSMRDPIGKADVSQDSHGLHIRAELAIDDPTAQKAYGLMREGIIDSLSVGYDVLAGGESFKNGRRELSRLKLYECSVVSLGMNDLARIDAVKSAMDCGNIRDLQDLLRAQLVLSERKAKKAATLFWPIVSGRDDSENTEQLAEQLKSFYETLKGMNHEQRTGRIESDTRRDPRRS